MIYEYVITGSMDNETIRCHSNEKEVLVKGFRPKHQARVAQ